MNGLFTLHLIGDNFRILSVARDFPGKVQNGRLINTDVVVFRFAEDGFVTNYSLFRTVSIDGQNWVECLNTGPVIKYGHDSSRGIRRWLSRWLGKKVPPNALVLDTCFVNAGDYLSLPVML